METSDTVSRTERIRRVVDETAECASVRDVAECVVDAAVDVLDGDAAIVATTDGDRFRPLAAHAPRLYSGPLRSSVDGIAGRTHQGGETIVVDDLATEDGLERQEFRSVLSVPVADGVFQVLSLSPAAFETRDVEHGELLASVFGHARKRVAYETSADRERDRFAALFENLPDPALQYTNTDRGLVIDHVNTAFVHVFGYEANEVVGERIHDVLVPDAEANDTLESQRDSWEFLDQEVERLTAGGTRPFLLRRVPIAADQGYCIYADIADLKARERELERQNELLDQFARIVSHDLRNPLNVAQGYLSMVRNSDADRTDEYYERIDTAHGRMDDIIADVLTMARHGQSTSDIEAVSLASTARDAWQNVPDTDASLVVTDDLSVRATEGQLKQVFENLFRNAFEHGGAETVTIGPLASEPPSADVRGFYVADDGVGIPVTVRNRVFDSGHSGTDGHGLGLAIVSTIAESFGWTVSVHESESGGARFEFADVDSNPDGRGQHRDTPGAEYHETNTGP